MTEGSVLACPACDSAHIRRRSGRNQDPNADRKWYCCDCTEDFDIAVRRESYQRKKNRTGGLSPIGQLLHDAPPDADFEDLRTDGGSVRPRYPHLAGRLETTKERLGRTRRMALRADDEELASCLTDAIAAADAALDIARGDGR